MLQSTLGRLAILYTFHRLSSSRTWSSRRLSLLIHFIAAIMVFAAIPMCIMMVTPCWPPNSTDLDKCWGFLSPSQFHRVLLVNIISGIINAVADLFAFAMPFVILRWAALSKLHRRCLYGLFSFGLVSVPSLSPNTNA